jgi:hypothetical protein
MQGIRHSGGACAKISTRSIGGKVNFAAPDVPHFGVIVSNGNLR